MTPVLSANQLLLISAAAQRCCCLSCCVYVRVYVHTERDLRLRAGHTHKVHSFLGRNYGLYHLPGRRRPVAVPRLATRGGIGQTGVGGCSDINQVKKKTRKVRSELIR